VNNHYWSLINNLPKSTVKSIITDNVLRMDQRSCDTILRAILKEKQEEDTRKQIRSQEKFINRNKTVYRHNKQLKNLESIGVRVRHQSQLKDSMANEFGLETSLTGNDEPTFGKAQRNSTFTTTQVGEDSGNIGGMNSSRNTININKA